MTSRKAGARSEISTPFSQVPLFVLLIKELTSGAFWLYAYFCCHAAAKTGRCRLSLHRVAQVKGASLRAVQSWRALLERLGLIVTLQKSGRSSQFLVIRNADQRDRAKQQNLVNLEPRRQRFRAFGQKGASARALVSEANQSSLPGDTTFPPGRSESSFGHNRGQT